MKKIFKWDKVMFYMFKRKDWTLVDGKEYIARCNSYIDKIQWDPIVFLEWFAWWVMVSHCEILERFNKKD